MAMRARITYPRPVTSDLSGRSSDKKAITRYSMPVTSYLSVTTSYERDCKPIDRYRMATISDYILSP